MPDDQSMEHYLRQIRNQIARAGEADSARAQVLLNYWTHDVAQKFANSDFAHVAQKLGNTGFHQNVANVRLTRRETETWVEFSKKLHEVSEVRPITRFKRPVVHLSWASHLQPMEPAVPPIRACSLLDRLLPRADRNVIRGDMEEEFRGRSAKDGLTRARRWFWRETVWTIVQHNPIVRSVLVGGLVRIGKWIFRQIGS